MAHPATPAPAKTIVPVKAGFFGGTASGKTTTAAMLALGISIELHDKAPVYVYDTEPGWHFLKPMFRAEGVELIIHPQRSFKGMREHIRIARSKGACVFAVDSMTHTWTELMDTFSKNGRVEFQDFNMIKREWNEWTVDFLNSPLHCLALGRLGYDYFQEEDERRPGKTKMVKGDSKFKAGGGESFGYEPNILFEMSRRTTAVGAGKNKKFVVVHEAYVEKDRSWAMHGLTLEFTATQRYEKGGYSAVYKAMLPHIKACQELDGPATLTSGNSASLVPEAEENWYKRKKSREIMLEEFDGSMQMLWSGSTNEIKQIRLVVGERLFGVKSKTALEEMSYPLDKIELGVRAIRAFEKHYLSLAENERPRTHLDILAKLDIYVQQETNEMQQEAADQAEGLNA